MYKHLPFHLANSLLLTILAVVRWAPRVGDIHAVACGWAIRSRPVVARPSVQKCILNVESLSKSQVIHRVHELIWAGVPPFTMYRRIGGCGCITRCCSRSTGGYTCRSTSLCLPQPESRLPVELVTCDGAPHIARAMCSWYPWRSEHHRVHVGGLALHWSRYRNAILSTNNSVMIGNWPIPVHYALWVRVRLGGLGDHGMSRWCSLRSAKWLTPRLRGFGDHGVSGWWSPRGGWLTPWSTASLYNSHLKKGKSWRKSSSKNGVCNASFLWEEFENRVKLSNKQVIWQYVFFCENIQVDA